MSLGPTRQVLGQAYIKADGNLLATLPGAVLSPGGSTFKALPVFPGPFAYVEGLEPSSLACEVAIDASTSVAYLQNLKNVTVTFECDTGQVYMVRQARTAKPVQISGSTAKLELLGLPAQETNNASNNLAQGLAPL